MVTNGIAEDNDQSLILTEPPANAGTNERIDIGELAQEYGQKIADGAVKARDFVSEKLDIAGQKLKGLQNRDFSEVAGQAKEYAKQNPGQVIVAAAAAGFLLGVLLKIGRR
jgi:ElaB/YqjD/DUF883 family membrane-anchored ribosome-binding protein